MILRDGAKLSLNPAWLAPLEADLLFETLFSTLQWRQESVRLFGKLVPQPRLVAWYGDASYTYSGLTLNPLPWTEELRALKERLEETTGALFNSMLANLYRTGRDSVGMHADNEPELGPEPVIASVSLGATRRFLIEDAVTRERQEVHLTNGSLLVMAGTMQTHYRHGVPKTKAVCGPRINLTFRKIG
jgi:alkylated DNA repair dioxygenase AlkB